MPVIEVSGRRGSIPVVYVKGNHYEVGFDVGRTFASMIHSYVDRHTLLNSVLIPLYGTPEGKAAYDETLDAVVKDFPQYVAELEGTADGAKVPFYKLFLLHLDDILPGVLNKVAPYDGPRCSSEKCNFRGQFAVPTDRGGGCSTAILNMPDEAILGHNEDALSETLSHIYLVSAHVIADEPQGKWGVKEERFTALCYAGTLPGFCMSYNNHGFAYSINIICVKTPRAGKSPRSFICRALLASRNLKEAEQVMRDSELGIGNGMSVNMAFVSDGPVKFYNAEAGPGTGNDKSSTLSVVQVPKGEHLYHCNRFLRLELPEVKGFSMESSIHRHEAIDGLPKPTGVKDVADALGNESDPAFPVYNGSGQDMISTVATGIFNFNERTWSIYLQNPKHAKPIMVLPMILD